MNKSKSIQILQFIGDIFFFTISFYLLVNVRNLPIESHFWPFIGVITTLVLGNYIIGLYDRVASNYKENIFRIFTVHLTSFVLSTLFFYFSYNWLKISPKTNLLLFFIISFLFVNIWRYLLNKYKPLIKNVYVFGTGEDFNDLIEYLKHNKDNYYSLKKYIDLDKKYAEEIKKEFQNIPIDNQNLIVIDTDHVKIKSIKEYLYESIYSGIKYIEIKNFFEQVLKRIPLSQIDELWFLTYIQRSATPTYLFLKRSFDLLFCLFLLPTFLLFPIIKIFMFIEDRGKFFIYQSRVGLIGKTIKIPKIRNRKYDDPGVKFGAEKRENPVSRIGSIIKPLRIDELPQILSVIKGDLSLIGPRPEIKHIADDLCRELPYFMMRTLVKPGLSGWAQVNQDYVPSNLKETRLKLSYDFYYIKHRSISLEIQIFLKTIRTVLSRFGS